MKCAAVPKAVPAATIQAAGSSGRVASGLSQRWAAVSRPGQRQLPNGTVNRLGRTVLWKRIVDQVVPRLGDTTIIPHTGYLPDRHRRTAGR
jgi:hypothetical protein